MIWFVVFVSLRFASLRFVPIRSYCVRGALSCFALCAWCVVVFVFGVFCLIAVVCVLCVWCDGPRCVCCVLLCIDCGPVVFGVCWLVWFRVVVRVSFRSVTFRFVLVVLLVVCSVVWCVVCVLRCCVAFVCWFVLLCWCVAFRFLSFRFGMRVCFVLVWLNLVVCCVRVG